MDLEVVLPCPSLLLYPIMSTARMLLQTFDKGFGIAFEMSHVLI